MRVGIVSLLQVTYSQVLGVVGYSMLPLVITGPLVSLLRSLPWLSFLLKASLVNLLFSLLDVVTCFLSLISIYHIPCLWNRSESRELTLVCLFSLGVLLSE